MIIRGKSIAQAFLEAGAKVAICDISDSVTKCGEELSAHGAVHAIRADITKEGIPQVVFEEAAEKLGEVNILVNNAAISDHFEPVGDQDVELWDRLMAVNLRAPMLLSQVAVNEMLKHDHVNGNILNILSMAAHAGMVSGKISSDMFHDFPLAAA